MIAPVIAVLALLAVPALGGCSVAGGMSGSIGESGVGVGASVDLRILDGARGFRTKQQYDVRTVYVVPGYKAAP